jgi:hypothetical protein
MPSKEQAHSNDKAVSKRPSPKPATENLDMLAQQQSHPAAIIQRATLDPGSLTPRDVLRLQHTVGNRAVGRLLAGIRSRPAIQARLTVGAAGDRYEQEADRIADQVMSMPRPAGGQRPGVNASPDAQRQEDEELQTKPLAASITPLAQRQADEEEESQAVPLVQRQAEAEEEEEEQAQAQPLAQRQEIPEKEELQLKREPAVLQHEELPEEEEALRMKPEAGGMGPQGGQVPPDVEAAIRRARGGGQPLEGALQEQMSARLGHDLSGVRVHTDAEADGLNHQLSAIAFTTGPDIFFMRGAYAPSSSSGRELIAHELSHVVQQSQGRVHGGRSGMYVRPAGGGLEQEADTWARRARGQGGDGGRGAGIHGRQGPPGEEGGRCAEQGVVQRATQFVDPAAETWPTPTVIGSMVYYTWAPGVSGIPLRLRSSSYGTCAGFAIHARWTGGFMAGLLAHGWTPIAADVESVAKAFLRLVKSLANERKITWHAWSFGGATMVPQRETNRAQVRAGLDAGLAELGSAGSGVVVVREDRSEGGSEWALDVGSGVLTPSGKKGKKGGGRFAEVS